MSSDPVRSGARIATLLAALNLALPQLLAAPSLDQPVRYPANGHYYRSVITVRGISWSNAEQQAREMSYLGNRGHLVTLNSSEENRFVIEHCSIPAAEAYWIGGLKVATGDTEGNPWRWVTGEPWSFTNWQPGEPNNVGGTEDHLVMVNNGEWNDAPAKFGRTGFIVEFEPLPGARLELDPPMPWISGRIGVLRVSLPVPAGSGGATVRLSSDISSAVLPERLSLRAGESSVTIQIRAGVVTRRQSGEIRADYGGVISSTGFSVRPPGVALLEVIPVPAIGGQRITGQVTLEAPASDKPVVVRLSTPEPLSALSLPHSLTVPAGAISAVFTIGTRPIAAPLDLFVTADVDGVTATRRLRIQPSFRRQR